MIGSITWHNSAINTFLLKKNYAPHDKEPLAIFKACQKKRYYIDGYITVVFTDYKTLYLWGASFDIAVRTV